jgi:Lhr-like helicase
MIAHFKKNTENIWQASVNIEIPGPFTSIIVSRWLDKENYRAIISVLKEFKSVRNKSSILTRLLKDSGLLEFKFKDSADEALFILKYKEGMDI